MLRGLCLASLLILPAVQARAALEAVATSDGISVREDGKVLRAIKLGPLTPGFVPRLQQVSAHGRQLVEVRVMAPGNPTQQVWVGVRTSAGLDPIWTGTTGPRDADGETALDVAIDGDGIHQFQTAARITRCDGKPARMFMSSWNFERRRFETAPSSAAAPASGPTLSGRRADPVAPAGPRVRTFNFLAQSSALGAADAQALTAPLQVDDGNLTTVWAEGAPGDGRGEFLTARATADGYAIIGLKIWPGDTSSPEAFRARNRPRRLTLILGPGADQRFEVDLPEDPRDGQAHYREPFWVALPAPVPATCVTVVLEAVTSGAEAKTTNITAIGDIQILSDLDRPEGIARLIDDVARGGDCEARARMLAALGDEHLAALAPILAQSSGAGRECLLQGLASVGVRRWTTPAVAVLGPALMAALRGATPAEEKLVVALLGRLATPPVSDLAAWLGDGGREVDDRVRAARALAALPAASGMTHLLAWVGTGPGALRASLRQICATAPGAWAAAVLQTLAIEPDAAPERKADLAVILGAQASRDPAGHDAAIAGLRGLYRASASFEVRARVVAALGRLPGETAVANLAEIRAASDDPVLRALAARELAGHPDAAATRPALRAALGDPDPRAREAAAIGIGRRGDVGATATLIGAAKSEPWPFVRRAEVAALGDLCGPGAGDLLVRAVERDTDEVRRAALAGLVRCRDGRARDLLLRVLERRAESAALRGLAAQLLGRLGARDAAPALATAVASLLQESQADLAIEATLALTLGALVSLDSRQALPAALLVLADPRPAPKRAAVEALGRLCDPGAGRAALEKLASGDDEALAVTAAAALRRCDR